MKWEKDCDGDLPIRCNITHYNVRPLNIPIGKREGKFLSMINEDTSRRISNFLSGDE